MIWSCDTRFQVYSHDLTVGNLQITICSSGQFNSILSVKYHHALQTSIMDSGGEKDAPPAKTRKLQGAAMYKCKYMSQWKKSFPLLKLSREIHTGNLKKTILSLFYGS